MGFGPEVLIPLAISAATGVGGAIMTSNANKQNSADLQAATDARNRELTEYKRRMEGVQADADAANKKAQEAYGQPETAKREADTNAALTTQYDAAVTPTTTAEVPLGGSAPTVMQDAMATKAGENDKYTKDLSKRLAALGTNTQSLFQTSLGQARAGSQIDQATNFGKQETALLPQYQDFASTFYRLKPKNNNAGGEALTGLSKDFAKMAGSGWSG